MNNSQHRVRVGILGASGYAGAELIRLLARHPNAKIALLTGNRHAGERIDDIFPHLAGLGLPRLAELAPESVVDAGLDVVFCALPHGLTQDLAAGLLAAADRNGSGLKIVDLSPDFRLADANVYAAAYGRAATTRSRARFNFDVATISIVFVIWRVLSTDLMRRRSSRGWAIYCNALNSSMAATSSASSSSPNFFSWRRRSSTSG